MKKQNDQRIPDFRARFLPLLLSGLFSQVYPIISTALISHRLDITALSSAGALSPVSVLQSALFAGLGTGISLHLGIALNTPEENRIPSAIRGSLLVLTGAFLLSALLCAASDPLCGLLHISDELRADSTRYLRVLLAGSGLLTLKTALLQTHQNTGNIRFSSIASAGGIVLQSGLSILLFTVFPGQIWYVPASILLTNLFLSLWLLAALYLRYASWAIYRKGTISSTAPCLKDTDRTFFRAFTSARQIVRLGLSRSGMMALIGLGGFFLQRNINGLSADIIAGYSVGNVAVNLFMEPLNAMGVLMTVCLTGSKMQRNIEDALKAERFLLAKTLPYCLILVIFLPLGGRPLLALLSGSLSDAAVVNAGYLRLLITLPAFFPLTVYLISRNALQLLRPHALYLFGLLEFLWEIIGAVSIRRIGYPAAPLSIACAWITGAAACAMILLQMRREQKQKNDDDSPLS